MPVDDEFANEPWKMSPSRRMRPARIDAPLPTTVNVVIADQISSRGRGSTRRWSRNWSAWPRSRTRSSIGLKPCACRHSASPGSYRAPSFIPGTSHCRGVCLDEVSELARSYGIEPSVEDRRERGQPLPGAVSFRGELLPSQHRPFGLPAPRPRCPRRHDGVRQDGRGGGTDRGAAAKHAGPRPSPRASRPVGRASAVVSRHQAEADRGDRRRQAEADRRR